MSLRTMLAENPGMLISVCALLFTISSFWWIQRRPGKLVITEPRSFELGRAQDRESSDDVQIIVLPLVFFNKGAMPVIIQNLRLIRAAEGRSSSPFTFQNVVSGLGVEGQGDLATQFPVRGGEAALRHIQFLRIPANIEWTAGVHRFCLEAVIAGREGWRTLLYLNLNIRPSDVGHANTKKSWLIDNMRDA